MSMPLAFEAPSSAKMPTPIEVEFMSPANAPTPFEVVVLPPKVHAPFGVKIAMPIPVAMSAMTPFHTKAIPWDYTAEARRKGKVMFGEAVAAQGMMRTGRVYTPKHLAELSKHAFSRTTISEIGTDDLWRKIQAKEYSVIDQLNKTPVQISILALLQNFDAHKNALLRVLSEEYVPSNITGREMANIIHAAGAVASTLHQVVKFEWNHQEVIIHGNSSNPIYSRQTIPTIEGRRKIGEETYHHIERVNAVDKGKWWDNKIESILNWSGYKPFKGFGKNLQGITKPIKLKKHDITFDLGYEYTWREINDWSPPWPGPYYLLEQPIPCLEQTFQPTDVIYGSEEEEALAAMRNFYGIYQSISIFLINQQSYYFLSLLYLYNITVTHLDEPMTMTCNETMQQMDIDSKEDDIPEEIVKEVGNFENRPKSNLDETEIINLGDEENVKETQINVHLSSSEKREYTEFLREYEDKFAWSYDDMTGLSTSIVAHKLPTNPTCPPVKLKLRMFKPDMSLKIKEELTKHVKAKVLRVVEYPTWLANIVPMPKKDGKIWMDEEDAEKTAFITPWEMYCFKMMPFGLKNAGATNMRAMTTIFHDMIHKEIEVYVDDVIIKSKKATDHMEDLRKFFNRLWRYNLKLNPAKCAFRVPAGKLLGFIVSHREI
ncbi:uncharacterized protein [Nicotiana sylvestris]|uniref:uncharacterized protein n=1 Tax=Nicotiana sylvestris TaxID=4096 RepID=UPI00388C5D02